MRSLNSLKNMLAAMTQYLVTVLIGFVARAIFIKTLGADYLGLNSLFTSIISMLSVAELGIASAIVFNLYKPIAEKDKETVKSLMRFYQICYRLIACIVLILGVSTVPFLKYFIESDTINDNIYIIYSLFLCEAIFSYLLSYKRSILYANQKNYIINIADLIYTISVNVAQIAILLLTSNYILFLLIKIIFRVIENVFINLFADRKYSYLKDKNVKKLDKRIISDIFQKIRGLVFHKIGGFIVLGTDSIIISRFLGLATLGLYTNYSMIINTVSVLFTQLLTGTTAGIGNLLTENNPDNSYKVYRKLSLLNFWLFGLASISIYFVIEPFILIWLGSGYLLSNSVLLVICLNFYFQGMRKVINLFKEASGIFFEDRYIPLIESLVNLVASILLVKVLGLAGVFVGTMISTIILFIYSYPKYVYEPLFKKSKYVFFKEQIYYMGILIIAFICTHGFAKIITINNILLNLGLNLIAVLLIPNILFFLFFYKTEEFKYFKNFFVSLIHNRFFKKN